MWIKVKTYKIIKILLKKDKGQIIDKRRIKNKNIRVINNKEISVINKKIRIVNN